MFDHSAGQIFQVYKARVAGIPAIPRDKARKLVDIVREGMKRAKAAKAMPQVTVAPTSLEVLIFKSSVTSKGRKILDRS